MASYSCPQCNVAISNNAKYCSECGAPVEAPIAQIITEATSTGNDHPDAASSEVAKAPLGFGIAFLIFWLFALAPYFVLSDVDRKLNYVLKWRKVILEDSEEWQLYAASIWGVELVAVMLGAYAAVQLFRVRVWRSVQITITALWLGGPIAVLLMKAVIQKEMLSGLINDEYLAETTSLGNVADATLPSLIWALVWTGYLVRSRRVRDAYPDHVKPRQNG